MIWLPSSKRREREIPLPYRRIEWRGELVDWPYIAEPRCWDAPRAVADATSKAELLRGQIREVSVPESDMLAALWYLGHEPVLQAPIGPFDADFLLPNVCLVIEVDGRRWHADESRERRRDNYLRDHGYTVSHVPARDVLLNPLYAAAMAAEVVIHHNECSHVGCRYRTRCVHGEMDQWLPPMEDYE